MFGYSRFVVLPNLFIFVISCANIPTQRYSVNEHHSGDNIIDGVQFIKQKHKHCGPAALSTVMKYYGDDRDQEEIAKRVYTPELDGSLISDMRHYAEENGYDSYTKTGNIEKLKTFLDNKIPVILLVDRGTWKTSIPHYYVIYGYNNSDKSFIVNDGLHEARRISYANLESEWQKMNYMMLIMSK